MKAIPLIAIFISGCASAPISTAPVGESDMRECVAISQQHGIAGRAALRAGVEGARAVGVAKALDEVASAAHTSIPIWWIFAGYALTSAANGAIEAQDRRDGIVRECLRDRGYKVY